MKTLANYIDGDWLAPSGDVTIPVVDPYSENTIAQVPESSQQDVNRAVSAARAALPAWSATPAQRRAGMLERLSEALTSRADELAEIVVRDLGSTFKTAQNVHIGLPASVLAQQREYLSLVEAEQTIGNSLIVREPVGVVAAITPWNYPLHQVVAKVGPALMAGCTMVLKPSEVTPLIVREFLELIDLAGFPPGVVNLVWGTGPVVGEMLAGHPGVDFVSFTGSTAAGRRVAELAARHVTQTSLELGGKSASVVLPGAELERAVRTTVASCFLNSGQSCNAMTRLLVSTEEYSAAVDLAVAAAAKYTMGDPMDSDTRLGPVVSKTQQQRILQMISRAIDDGATLAHGSRTAPRERGFFVSPTILAGVTPGSFIEQSEVFGPVLSVIAYDGADDAVAVANGTPYGLAAAVWADSQESGSELARRLDAGMVDVNGGRYNSAAPFGGNKGSGYGRELGPFGVEEFLRLKTIQL